MKSRFFGCAARVVGAFILSAPMTVMLPSGKVQAAAETPSVPTWPRARHLFDIPAGELANALTIWAPSAGVQLLASSEILHGMRTDGIAAGEYTAEVALQKLLEGTSLNYRFAGKRTVAITDREAAVRRAHAQANQLETIHVIGRALNENSTMEAPPPYAGGQVATGAQSGCSATAA